MVRGYYPLKANTFTQNAALRKRKPRRSGAFVVNWYLPSCTDCWVHLCRRGCR
jgi:hypothetical protein